MDPRQRCVRCENGETRLSGDELVVTGVELVRFRKAEDQQRSKMGMALSRKQVGIAAATRCRVK